MLSYLLHRLWQSLVLMLLVSVIGFAILNLAPGGPLSQYALSPGMTREALDRIAHQMGPRPSLTHPVSRMDLETVAGAIGANPIATRDRFSRSSAGHLFATLLLMVSSTLISILIGTWIGIKGATSRYSIFDYAATVGAMIALSIPTFWFGLVAIYVFSLKLKWLPAGNMYTIGNGSFYDYAIHLIMPSLVLALVNIGRMEPLHADRHPGCHQPGLRADGARQGTETQQGADEACGRNALLPMITLAGLQLPTILGGALVTETVFTWPGMGRLFLDSLGYHDYPVVMGLLMFSAILVLLGSLIADLLVAFVDPRIRLG